MFQPRTISRTSRLRLPAGHAAARGYTVSGAMTFSPSAVAVSALTADDGTVYPFGSVLATGCQDSTDYVVSQGGSAITLGVEPRTVFDLTVVFEPTAQAWLVENISENTASC